MPKPFLTYEQQLIKLRDEKHLVINDESAACCKLRQISYYSLVSGYLLCFEKVTLHTPEIRLQKAENHGEG